MATLAEIRSSILDQISGHLHTDDTLLTEEMIDYQIRKVRAMLFVDDLKNTSVEAGYLSRLSCIPVETSTDDCGCSDCPSQISACVPSLIGGNSILYVGTPDFSKAFMFQPPQAFLSWKRSRWGVAGTMFTYYAGKLWFKDIDQLMERIGLVAVLQDPLENTCVVNVEEEPYPVPESKIHKLELLVIKQLLSTGVQPDLINNGNDNRQVDPSVIKQAAR